MAGMELPDYLGKEKTEISDNDESSDNEENPNLSNNLEK